MNPLHAAAEKMTSAASYLTATSSARQVGASTSESQSPLSVPLDQPLTANVDEQQQHPANPSPTYTTLTPVRSAEPQPQNTEVDERIEVAQIMGQLKQGWEAAHHHQPLQLQMDDANASTNQITVDITDQVKQLEQWRDRELHVTLRLPSPQIVTVTIPPSILSPTSRGTPPSNQHSNGAFSDHQSSISNGVQPPLRSQHHDQSSLSMNGIVVSRDEQDSFDDSDGEGDDGETTNDQNIIVKPDGTRMWVCHLCPHERIFAKKYTLKKHFLNIHGNQQRHNCDLCPLKFFRQSDLAKHRALHTSEKKYQCSLCQQRFTQRSHQLRHLMRIHGFKPEQARGQVEEEQKVRKLQESDQKPSVERLVLSNQQHMAKVVELPQGSVLTVRRMVQEQQHQQTGGVASSSTTASASPATTPRSTMATPVTIVRPTTVSSGMVAPPSVVSNNNDLPFVINVIDDDDATGDSAKSGEYAQYGQQVHTVYVQNLSEIDVSSMDDSHSSMHNSASSSKERHRTAHICNYCGRTFGRIDALREHRQNMHTGDEIKTLSRHHQKLHICSLCNMTFSRPKRLRQHEWQAHKLGEPVDPDPVRFPCERCGLTFTRTANLRRHQQAGVCKGDNGRMTQQAGATLQLKAEPIAYDDVMQ